MFRVMKRFNLIDSVKSLMSNYSNKRGDQYFNIGMTTEFNLVSSQITMVIVNKMRIVLTLVNSNLGLYITYLQN